MKIPFVSFNQMQKEIKADILNKFEEMNVIGAYEEEHKILNTLKVVEVDVLIVSLFKSKFDGFNIIETLRNNSNDYIKPKRIIAVTHFVRCWYIF